MSFNGKETNFSSYFLSCDFWVRVSLALYLWSPSLLAHCIRFCFVFLFRDEYCERMRICKIEVVDLTNPPQTDEDKWHNLRLCMHKSLKRTTPTPILAAESSSSALELIAIFLTVLPAHSTAQHSTSRSRAAFGTCVRNEEMNDSMLGTTALPLKRREKGVECDAEDLVRGGRGNESSKSTCHCFKDSPVYGISICKRRKRINKFANECERYDF